MTKNEFDQLVKETEQSHPLWFQLDRAPPAADEELATLEGVLGCRLAPEHRDFLMTYGAGLFAFANVLGVRPGGDSYLGEAMAFTGAGFVPAIDTGTGDYYGFLGQDGQCSPKVVYWDHDSTEVKDTDYRDFYELVAAVGLRP